LKCWTVSSDRRVNADCCLQCCCVHADLEAGAADLVWPMSNPIVASAASQCCTLMAVALANNDIVIWNRNIGKYRQTVFIHLRCGQDFLKSYLRY